MMDASLNITVVGHTNTGKTSLLRTLSRDENFGEVCDEPSTTRHVEGMKLVLSDGTPAMSLFDTPGLEDPGGVLDLLEHLAQMGRYDGPERVQHFLQMPEARSHYEQEAKVLRQVMQSDAAIYVIDSCEPVLGKYKDELSILTYCAVPVLPVLNFVALERTREAEWRAQLARVNLHAVVAFDTVVFDEHSEQRLYERLRTLLDDRHDRLLSQLLQDRREQAHWLRRAAAEQLAELLLDSAAYQRLMPKDTDPEVLRLDTLRYQDEIRQREQQCVDALLGLFRFSRRHVSEQNLPLVDGSWEVDLFSPDAVKHYGLRLGGGAAAGAAAGATIDAATLGATMGLGTASGTAIGLLLGGSSTSLKQRMLNRMRGYTQWHVNEHTLTLLALRQLALIRVLLKRGHAAQSSMALIPAEDKDWHLPKTVKTARLKPEWSRINSDLFDANRIDRHRAVRDLTEELLRKL